MGDRSALADQAICLSGPACIKAHGAQHVDIGSALDRVGMDAVGGEARLNVNEGGTIQGLWDAIGRVLDLCSPKECANCFANAGCDAD